MSKTVPLGQKLRVFRKRAGLSQFELEIACDMAAGTLSRIESGTTKPQLDTLKRISKALELNTWERDYFYGSKAVPVSEQEIDNARREFLDTFKSRTKIGYLIDDRQVVREISPGFVRALRFTKEDINRLLNLPVLNYLLDDNLGLKSLIDAKYYEDILRNVLRRIYLEMSFMEGEEVFEDNLKRIEQDPLANRLWAELKKNEILGAHDEDRRIVFLQIAGLNIKTIYSVEALAKNDRFRIIQYTPTNILIEQLLKLL